MTRATEKTSQNFENFHNEGNIFESLFRKSREMIRQKEGIGVIKKVKPGAKEEEEGLSMVLLDFSSEDSKILSFADDDEEGDLTIYHSF